MHAKRSRVTIEIECLTCGATHHGRPGTRFCSRKCGAQYRQRKNRVTMTCRGCGSRFTIGKAKTRGGRRKHCNRACKARQSQAATVGADGRVLLLARAVSPEDRDLAEAMADRKGYVPRARLVAAKAWKGAPLATNEIAHHENEDPTDDRPENLAVVTRAHHTSIHNARRLASKSARTSS